MNISAMTSEQLETLIRKAIRDELNESGLRIDDADHQFEAREDFRFLRKLRKALDGASSKIGMAVLMALVSGIIWLFVSGIGTIFPNR